ncbi:hypothetical protein OIU84_030155 [Salix udensis]|uniref:Ferulate 5-hydroxylase n=1 Tax=Salix udensis TaxID=889485 RepID=A0AAD6P8R9_9ROSI|nr:hypothetical protein OIU84_030155 [Salix udensis]
MDSLLQSSQIVLVSLFLIAVSSLFFLGLLSRRRRRLPYPPGPKGLPLVGSMHMMDQLTHRGLAKLAKQYGGLFHMRMGYLHMVTVSSAEVARQVLQVQDNIFSNRPANIAIRYLTYDRADMAFAHYGPFWRQMRKLCVMKLFSRKRAESAAFGAKNEGQDEFIKILQEFSKLFGAFNISDFVPWLGWIDPQGLTARLVKARKDLDKFIDCIIDDHIQKRKEKNFSEDAETDMVDDMLAFYSEEARKVDESDDLQKTISLTKDNIKAIIMVITDTFFLQYPTIPRNNILHINICAKYTDMDIRLLTLGYRY